MISRLGMFCDSLNNVIGRSNEPISSLKIFVGF